MDENANKYEGLTAQEIRNRLKHIAGLCYALSCDLKNLEIEAEYLRLENESLRKKLEAAGVKKIPIPPASLNGMKQIITRKTGKHFECGDKKPNKIKAGGAPKGNQNARKKPIDDPRKIGT